MVITINPVYEWIDDKLVLVSHDGQYEHDGAMDDFCGGAPSGQSDLANAQTAAYTQDAAQQHELFSEDQALATEIEGVYGPIFAKGPSQLGFSQGELNNLNSEAATGVGQSFQAANQAVKESIASEGGGNTQLPSGVLTKAEQSTAVAGASQLSGEESQILGADYTAGTNEFNAATNALLGVGTVFNPGIAEAGVQNQAGSAANTTEEDIAQENESPWGAVLGAIGGVAGAAAGGFAAHK